MPVDSRPKAAVKIRKEGQEDIENYVLVEKEHLKDNFYLCRYIF